MGNNNSKIQEEDIHEFKRMTKNQDAENPNKPDLSEIIAAIQKSFTDAETAGCPNTAEDLQKQKEMYLLLINEQLEKLAPLSFGTPKLKKLFMEKYAEFKQNVTEARPIRVVVIGIQGHGKSSTINALLGRLACKSNLVLKATDKIQWETLSNENKLGVIDVLDTIGVTDNDDKNAKNLEQLETELRRKPADIILYIVEHKSIRADSYMHAAKALQKLSEIILKCNPGATAKDTIPVIAVITHCDTLPPHDVKLQLKEEGPLTYEDTMKLEKKREEIKKFKKRLREQFDDYPQQLPIWSKGSTKFKLAGIIPVCTEIEWSSDEPEENPSKINDNRWNIEELKDKIWEVAPKCTLLNLARLLSGAPGDFTKYQKIVAGGIVTTISIICGIIGLEPIPFADILLLVPLQALMVSLVAFTSGRVFSMEASCELFAMMNTTVGIGFALRSFAGSALKFIPVAGDILCGITAMLATAGFGAAAIVHFIEHRSVEEVTEKMQSVASLTLDKAQKAYALIFNKKNATSEFLLQE